MTKSNIKYNSGCLCDVDQLQGLITGDIYKLVVGLVKCCTTAPMKRSTVMPVQPFMTLFRSWKGNWLITMEQLRMKTLTLLALSMMLRLSDVTPRVMVHGQDTQHLSALILSTESVCFHPDGSSVTITLHGIKNDYSRDGFEVTVPSVEEVKVDPVAMLWCYME